MEERGSERRVNHALEFLKSYWFLVAFTFGAIGTMATLWFRVEFVIQAVNPDSITEYQTEQAILSTKREIRWCLGKAALLDKTAKEVLTCAD